MQGTQCGSLAVVAMSISESDGVTERTPHLAARRRDSRVPPASSPAASATMKANRARETGPEVRLRQELRRLGVVGYRKNWRAAPGRPDIAFPAKKVAVFVHGCFWHRCPHCALSLPRSNTAYWESHFRQNELRDARKISDLTKLGWRVRVVWECELRKAPTKCARDIRKLVVGSDSPPSREESGGRQSRDTQLGRGVRIA